MSEGPTAGAAHRVGSGTARVVRAWKALPNESRLAAYASIGLFVTLFLPWYQVTLIAPEKTALLQSASASITGWGAFSFVEAAVLVVAAGVLILLFQRAEGRAFHLPGGDGGVIMAAGLWTCLLIVWRIFDKQGATTKGPSATTSGIEWGIFVALAAAAFLAYAGSRIRAAHRPEPPLPGEDSAPIGSSAAATTVAGEAAPRKPRRAEDRARRPAPADDRSRRTAPADDRSRRTAPADDRSRRTAPADDRPRQVRAIDPRVPLGRRAPISRRAQIRASRSAGARGHDLIRAPTRSPSDQPAGSRPDSAPARLGLRAVRASRPGRSADDAVRTCKTGRRRCDDAEDEVHYPTATTAGRLARPRRAAHHPARRRR